MLCFLSTPLCRGLVGTSMPVSDSFTVSIHNTQCSIMPMIYSYSSLPPPSPPSLSSPSPPSPLLPACYTVAPPTIRTLKTPFISSMSFSWFGEGLVWSLSTHSYSKEKCTLHREHRWINLRVKRANLVAQFFPYV